MILPKGMTLVGSRFGILVSGRVRSKPLRRLQLTAASSSWQMSDMLQLVVEIGITQAMISPVTSHIESSQSCRQAEACRTFSLRLCVKIIAEKRKQDSPILFHKGLRLFRQTLQGADQRSPGSGGLRYAPTTGYYLIALQAGTHRLLSDSPSGWHPPATARQYLTSIKLR